MEKQKHRRWSWLLAALAIVLILLGLDYWNLLPHKTYTAEHFGIETLQSPLDADGDGIDDYTDIMLGARQAAIIVYHHISPSLPSLSLRPFAPSV